MRIAITAASGHLGSEIVKATSSIFPEADVVALARTPERARGLGVEVLPGDYEDRAELEHSLRDVDSVLLVSGMAAPDLRIEQHRNVIEAARNSGVRKLVYTSVQGAESGTAFSPIVASNRQTEEDIRSSGLDWAIGRNGIYIEPDVEYVQSYVEMGGIRNCASDGRCGYTTRSELAYAYAQILADDRHIGHTYNLHGDAITQQELADYINGAFGTELTYTSMTVDEYRDDRIAELGEFMGQVIAGIYEGIREGAADNPSHYELAAGKEHVSWPEYFGQLAN
ncbi:MAG: NAD(P)H-binding protein [Actinobacteria bacterium]|nr:NAD(P)H-binding protein [Actinomycetota bacterium]